MPVILKPQPGPQELFLSTPADIALYGGAAGGGKTYALLLEQLRHINNPEFGSVIFRRTSGQIFNEGGLWDNALNMYKDMNTRPVRSPRATIIFDTKAKITFTHLQYEKDKFAWQGSQIPLICFDELTHFTAGQFFYLLSRNRSTCGVRPYVRATTNPDADSWVAPFIQWYWDKDTGYAIPERSGVIRYFVRLDDEIKWGDSQEELLLKYPGIIPEQIKSFTFIASKLSDNKVLMDKDPGYLGNLLAQNKVEQERLLKGNWKIKPAAGLYFKSSQVQIVEAIPHNVVAWIRSWDLAATVPTPDNPNPDATAGVLMGRLDNGMYIVADVQRVQRAAHEVRQLTRNISTIDRAKYKFVRITIPQDPGQAGKDQAVSYVKHLSGFSVTTVKPTGDKITRAEPFSAQWQAGNVLLLAGDWNESYLAEMEGFPDAAHDDMVDASSDAFNKLQDVTDWGGLSG